MPGGVEEHSDILLGLNRRQRGSHGDCLRNRVVQVAHLKVEVHHRALVVVGRWPHRGLVSGGLLKHEVDVVRVRLVAARRPSTRWPRYRYWR